jgi:multiple sugar transport system ATP-binding protein
MAEIRAENLSKTYRDGTKAVDDVSVVIPDGQLVVLVGPSGCGKTTMLRMIAGLETITSGTLSIGGVVVNDIAPKDRDIAMIFQNYALYPHMSVYDNIGFGLKLRHERRRSIDERVRRVAKTLGLEEQLEKKPKQLSGGQRQRVAMGRAIVRQPRVFLMDEPLSNLDAKLRVQMRAEIARLQKELRITTIYVTHDQTEAMTLGDIVVVMRQGVIQQVDQPQLLYRSPKNLFVAGFIGSPAMNLVEARLSFGRDGPNVTFGSCRLEIPPEIWDARSALRSYVDRNILLGIRPEHISDGSLSATASPSNSLDAVVDLREDMGSEVFIHFTVDAPPVLTEDIRELAVDTDATALNVLEELALERRCEFVARLGADSSVNEGEEFQAVINTRNLHFFDTETREAIYAESTTQEPARESALLEARR